MCPAATPWSPGSDRVARQKTANRYVVPLNVPGSAIFRRDDGLIVHRVVPCAADSELRRPTKKWAHPRDWLGLECAIRGLVAPPCCGNERGEIQGFAGGMVLSMGIEAIAVLPVTNRD